MRTVLGGIFVFVLTAQLIAQSAARAPVGDLIAEALARNPNIAAAQKRYDAARQRQTEEGALPDPMISAGYNASGNPLPGAGLGTAPTANIGFMISQELPYSGKRSLRSAVSSREADAQFTDIDAARFRVASEVRQAYYRLAFTYAAEDVLIRNHDLLETLQQVSESRYAVGEGAQQDVIKAQTAVTTLQLRRERVLQERATREGELNALLARPPSASVGQPDDLELTPFDTSLESLVALSLERTPMLARDRIMIDRSQLAVQSAQKEFKPDVVLSGGYFYMGSMPPMYEFRVDMKIPLQRGRRDAAVAEQINAGAAARTTYESTRLMLQRRIQEDYQMASTSARLARLYRDAVIPQAKLALESSLSGYQTGAIDLAPVLGNFGTVLEYELNYLDELASFHAALSRLDEMTGAPLGQ